MEDAATTLLARDLLVTAVVVFGLWMLAVAWKRGMAEVRANELTSTPKLTYEEMVAERQKRRRPVVDHKRPITDAHWVYIDPASGEKKYAGSTSCAEELIRRGVKVTPVFAVEESKPFWEK